MKKKIKLNWKEGRKEGERWGWFTAPNGDLELLLVKILDIAAKIPQYEFLD